MKINSDDLKDDEIVLKKIQIQGRKLEVVDEAISPVYRSMSSSRPGLFHLTVVVENPITNEVRAVCSCDGFCFKGKCWHIDAIWDEEWEGSSIGINDG